jgi:hypothetical protein
MVLLACLPASPLPFRQAGGTQADKLDEALAAFYHLFG